MTVRLCVAYLLFGCGSLVSAAAVSPTFSKDVAPILYSRCLECHRQGEAAPMAFTSYSEVRPWAKAIKQAVLTRKMPPWLADPHLGAFRNWEEMMIGWFTYTVPYAPPSIAALQPRPNALEEKR